MPWRRRVEPFIRPLFQTHARLFRGLTLGVRALVIDGEGRVFLVKHSYVAGWHLPGGGVEPGETLLAALARELREEGNIELAGPPRLHGLFHNARVSRRDHVALFVVRDFHQDAAPVPDLEIIAHGFSPWMSCRRTPPPAPARASPRCSADNRSACCGEARAVVRRRCPQLPPKQTESA